MNRIDKKLAKLKSSNKKMLSPYLTAGDPHPELTVTLMHGLVQAGADILELGIPFSDPMAEGPVIQQAMERALAHGVRTQDVLRMVEIFRQTDQETPVVVMGYVNPIEQYGYEPFVQQAIKAGVDGTILVDLPPEEYKDLASIWQHHGLYSIFLCSPTTSAQRMKLINQWAQGYLYYVSLKGVTGADLLEVSSVQTQYQARKAQTTLPLMLGFGIKTPEIAAEVGRFADGVIVGAALITRIVEAYPNNESALQAGTSFLSSLRDAMDNTGNKS